MKKNYILFIDSGIGGLTTLCECVKNLNADYLYFADNDNAPYGNHTATEIYEFLKRIISSLLLKFNIKIIVLACNTATTSAIRKLRLEFSNIIFIGTEPAIKLAENNKYSKACCTVTPATSKQKQFKSLVKSSTIKIRLYMPKMLALCIEKYYTIKTIINFYNLYKELINISKNSKHCDCIVLGCTHYIFLKEHLCKLTRKKVFDGNQGVSKQLQKIYNNIPHSKNIKSTIKFFVSNNKINSKEIYKKIFQEILAKV